MCATAARMKYSPSPVHETAQVSIVRVGPGADDRRVADPAKLLVRRPAGGSAGREVAGLVERDCADGAVLVLVAHRHGPCAFIFLQRLPALVGVEIFLVDKRDAHLFRERLRALAREHDVRRFLHHHPREADRIANVLHARDRPGFERFAVHDRGVELVRALMGEDRAFAGVEQRVVLQHMDRRLDRVEARAAFLQHLVAGLERIARARRDRLSLSPAVICCARSCRRRHGSPCRISSGWSFFVAVMEPASRRMPRPARSWNRCMIEIIAGPGRPARQAHLPLPRSKATSLSQWPTNPSTDTRDRTRAWSTRQSMSSRRGREKPLRAPGNREHVLVHHQHRERDVRSHPARASAVSRRQFLPLHRTRRRRLGAAGGDGFVFSRPNDGAADRLPIAALRDGAAGARDWSRSLSPASSGRCSPGSCSRRGSARPSPRSSGRCRSRRKWKRSRRWASGRCAFWSRRGCSRSSRSCPA